jgi:hypothetical protein
MPEKIRVGNDDFAFGGGLPPIGLLDVTAVAQVVANHPASCVPTRSASVRKQAAFGAQLHELHQRPHRCMVCAIAGAKWPSTLTAKSSRGGFAWRAHVVDRVDAPTTRYGGRYGLLAAGGVTGAKELPGGDFGRLEQLDARVA